MRLRPCPFCGANAKEPHDERPYGTSGDDRSWAISCGVFCVTMRRHTKGQVIKDWNFRRSGRKNK